MESMQPADILLINGFVYTADSRETICEAVAVRGQDIVFTGSSEEARCFAGEKTQVIDLQGKMVTPGFLDTHLHPPGLSLVEMCEVDLSHLHNVADYCQAVRDYLVSHPGATAIYGRGWSWGALHGEERRKGPRKEYLDAITEEIPIILRAADGHTLWLNSKALAISGVTKETPEPHGGVIETDDSGELWGTLKETAMQLAPLPEYTIEQYMAAMEAFQHKMHSLGITGILCLGSMTFVSLFEAMDRLRRQGKLLLRVRGAMTVRHQEELQAQLRAIEAVREQYNNEDLKVICAKFFTDGVIEGGTSHLLEPYTAQAGRGEGYRGDFLWDTEKLQEAFVEVNRRGLQIHVHSTGDASTRLVLNALEQAQKTLGPGDCRNTITHLQLVAPEDLPRFKELELVASVQPFWHFKLPNWWEAVDKLLLGERAEAEFPLGSFFEQGVVVTSSSDYPATLVPNPLHAIEIGVTRNLDNGAFYGLEDITDMNDERYLLNIKERASVAQMLKSYTANGSYALFMENMTGSLEPGKRADLVVLEENILDIDPVRIDQVKVRMTFFNGKLVYQA